MTILTNAGFAVKSGTFYARTVTTGTDGAFRATSLPVYNGTNKISYTVTEVAAPANYLLDATSQTQTLEAGESGYAAAMTFTNPPMAKAVITKTYYRQWEQDSGNKVDYALAGAEIAIFEEVDGQARSGWRNAVHRRGRHHHLRGSGRHQDLLRL